MVYLAVKKYVRLQQVNLYFLLLGRCQSQDDWSQVSAVTCITEPPLHSVAKTFKLFPSQYILKSLLQVSYASSDSKLSGTIAVSITLASGVPSMEAREALLT
jgi:hypothetical protein